MGIRLVFIVAAAAVGVVAGPPATAASPRTDVSFEISNSLGDGGEHVIHGFRMDPDCDATSVILLQHGLSYTSETWDFPGYSYARILADAGYAVVAIDRLGYGRSTLEDGYGVNALAHGDIAHQVVVQLRESYDQVVIAGHSAGAEASETAASLYGDVDALIAMGYHHYPSAQIVQDFFTGDYPRALLSDYEYFLGTPEHRAFMFFTEHADPAVVAADTAAAVLTPSGEILTLGPQPSRYVHFLTPVPVLLQIGDSDRLFPLLYEDIVDLEPFLGATFLGAQSVTVDVVPDAGHTYMLHPTGPAAAERIATWLETVAGISPCEVGVAEDGVTGPVQAPPTAEPLPSTGGGASVAAMLGLVLAASSGRGRLREPVL